MLILFDIDGTLLLSGGAGQRAMESAGRELYGAAFTCAGVPFAGRLDPLIWRALAERNGVADAAGEHARFRATYARHLGVGLARATVNALPGVVRLLDELAPVAGWTLGVLTGNYPETGRSKLVAAGLAPERFAVEAWGDDGEQRADLVPVARERYRARTGAAIDAGDVLVIGDTPSDVACAQAHGCRSLAVATGLFEREHLEAAGAHRAVDDLADTADVLDWIRRPPLRREP